MSQDLTNLVYPIPQEPDGLTASEENQQQPVTTKRRANQRNGSQANGTNNFSPLSSNDGAQSVQRKKIQRTQSPSYGDITASTNLAVFYINYPDDVFDERGVEEVKKTILFNIDILSPGSEAPVIKYVKRKDGAVMVNCSNNASAAMVTQYLNNKEMLGKIIRCVPWSQLQRPPAARLWIPDMQTPLEVIMARLQKQNSGIKATTWRIIYHKAHAQGRMVIAQIDVETNVKMTAGLKWLNYALGLKVSIKKVSNPNNCS